jgi:hypothetical protein
MSDRPSVIEIRISRRLLWWVVGIFLTLLVLSVAWTLLQTTGGHGEGGLKIDPVQTLPSK